MTVATHGMVSRERRGKEKRERERGEKKERNYALIT